VGSPLPLLIANHHPAQLHRITTLLLLLLLLAVGPGPLVGNLLLLLALAARLPLPLLLRRRPLRLPLRPRPLLLLQLLLNLLLPPRLGLVGRRLGRLLLPRLGAALGRGRGGGGVGVPLLARRRDFLVEAAGELLAGEAGACFVFGGCGVGGLGGGVGWGFQCSRDGEDPTTSARRSSVPYPTPTCRDVELHALVLLLLLLMG